jgi:hypothetical protein
MLRRRLIAFTLGLALAALPLQATRAFELTFSFSNLEAFTPTQVGILTEAITHVEGMWEHMLTGYQAAISIPSVPIDINPTNSGLASASYSGTTFQGGFTLATSGFVNINTLEIENFANWQGPGANGLNFIDELIAHEVGHVLGIGTLWSANSVYSFNSFQYTGQHGVAAYQAEFNEAIPYLPVENAGNPGTPNAHWDQLMRSSPQEGNPLDPWSLDPRVGVVDEYGRDRGLELMTGAIDPDYFEPFVSRFTIQSMRDMGYTVTEFEDFNGDGVVDLADRAIVLENQGMSGMQIDSMRFGDANRDRVVDMDDFRLWQIAAGVPEPGSLALALFAVAHATLLRRGLRRGNRRK